jgi:type II secretory pathway predicted ATPase ExeA
MTTNAVFRTEDRYVPLKLKGVMLKHRIAYKSVCPRVLQMNGKQLSEPALNLLLNWGTWPSKTPADSIKKQVETYLRELGIAEDEIAAVWDNDTPLAGHTPQLSISKENAIERTERLKDLQQLEVEMLTKEAKVHFEVPTTPFQSDVNGPEDVFMTKELRAAFNALYYTAKHAGIMALIAESGGGKSTLRRMLDDTIRERQEPIRIVMPQAVDKRMLTAGQISEAIIRDLNPDARIPGSLERRARALRDLLEASKTAGNSNVLLIEEAHDLPTDTLKHLKRFWEMEKGFTKLLGIILIGQTELARKLNANANFEAREFINRCEVFELSPMGSDLEGYLEFKFKRVGVPVGRVFAKDAYDAIRAGLTVKRRDDRSLFYPMYVNIAVTKAMNLTARLGAPKVNAEIIEKILPRQ